MCEATRKSTKLDWLITEILRRTWVTYYTTSVSTGNTMQIMIIWRRNTRPSTNRKMETSLLCMWQEGLLSLSWAHMDYIIMTSRNMLNMVEELQHHYTKWQYERALEARKLYQAIRVPSFADYKKIITMNAIRNCSVTIKDINICEKIFGPNIYNLKGKTVQKTPSVVTNNYIEIL